MTVDFSEDGEEVDFVLFDFAATIMKYSSYVSFPPAAAGGFVDSTTNRSFSSRNGFARSRITTNGSRAAISVHPKALVASTAAMMIRVAQAQRKGMVTPSFNTAQTNAQNGAVVS